MTRILWDQVGERFYETGTDHGVLYVNDGVARESWNSDYAPGEAWNGLTGFTKSSDGGTATKIFADNIKYLNLIATEDRKFTIKCYTYPDAWDLCNGLRKVNGVKGLRVGQQTRRPFGFCCRTLIGNDTEGTDLGYKLNICYGATASPSDEDYQTVNDNPSAIEFSYEAETIPETMPGYTGLKPCAIFEIDSRDFEGDDIEILNDLEDVLYGTEISEPRLPKVAELLEILGGTATFTLKLIQGDETTLSVIRGADEPLSNNAAIKADDVLTISVVGGTVKVNDVPFTSGNTFTVVGDTKVESTAT